MPQVPAPAPFTDADYELIAAAVLETARGRWFLAEHARRNRQADTRLVLEAIEKLERTIAHRPEMPESDRVRVDLIEMMNAITRTKAEIAAIQPSETASSHFDQATLELDAIVDATEKATSDILAAAERVQEIAWTLREQGVDASVCDLIDSHATEVYTACSFQDITGQRTRKVIEVLRYLEARIDAMVRIWRLDDLEFAAAAEGAPAAPQVRGPQETGSRLKQQAVDKLIGVERKPDVFWRDARPHEGNAPRSLDEFDLDDLVVFEPAAEAQLRINHGEVQIEDDVVVRDVPQQAAAPAAPPVQPAGQETRQETGQENDKKEEGRIESLTFTERMALFG